MSCRYGALWFTLLKEPATPNRSANVEELLTKVFELGKLKPKDVDSRTPKMPAKIHGGELPAQEIFSDHYCFAIPRYQRPYAWTTEQTGELLDDLLGNLNGHAPVDQLDPYFLGSIVLIKEDKIPASQVVDGQQRLTTLTILLATL